MVIGGVNHLGQLLGYGGVARYSDHQRRLAILLAAATTHPLPRVQNLVRRKSVYAAR